jgi:hypothetical protein
MQRHPFQSLFIEWKFHSQHFLLQLGKRWELCWRQFDRILAMGKTKGENVSLSFLDDNMYVIVLKLKGSTCLLINKLPVVKNEYNVKFDKKWCSHFKLCVMDFHKVN